MPSYLPSSHVETPLQELLPEQVLGPQHGFHVLSVRSVTMTCQVAT